MRTLGLTVALIALLASSAAAQTCLVQAAGSPQQAVLTWTYTQGAPPQYGTATNFRIMRSTAQNGPFSLLVTVPITTLSYTDSSVLAATTYYYQVLAVNAAGAAPPANQVCKTMLTMPPAPTGTVTITLLSQPGTVASLPVGINCPGRCSNQFAAGARVTLQATPKPPNKIVTWSGGGCGPGHPDYCVVTVPDSQEIIVAVLFEKK